jgi:poly(A) polymerase
MAFNAFRNIWVVKAYHVDGIETDIAPIFAIFPELAGKANVPMPNNPGSPYSQDLLEDTYSRDFTFNSLYYDYANGDIIDYHGGLHDLRDGLVNTVVDADLKVRTDPCLILCGLQFAAKYDFKVSDEFDRALKEHSESSLATIDTYNAVYNMESGFNGAFALKYYDLLYAYKVPQFFWTSLKERFGTSEYDDLVRGLLGELDRQGKVDMALPLAAIFWPRFADDIKAKANPTDADVKAIWETIDKENADNYKFDYKDYTYIPQFIQDVWYLQLQMADSANQTADKAAEIRKAGRFDDALRLLKARAAFDSSLSSLVEFWS